MPFAKIGTLVALAVTLNLTPKNGALAASPVQVAAAASATPISILGVQHDAGAQIMFALDRSRKPTVRQVPGGIEIHAEGNLAYLTAGLPKLREVTGIEVRTEGNTSIALIRLANDCDTRQESSDHNLMINLQDKANVPMAPKSTRTAKTPSQAQTKPPMRLRKQASGQEQSKANAKPELDALRDNLAQKIALLAPPAEARPPSAGNGPTGTAETPTPQPATARPPCPPELKMEGWKGDEKFAQRLQALRVLAARMDESADAMAALAEFYIGNGLGAEALAVIQQSKLDPSTLEQRKRTERDADVARLLKGQPIDSASLLLADSANCARSDLPLWRALSAAQKGDLPAIQRDAEAAGQALTVVPSPLSNIFALRIADAAQGDPSVLRAMAAALRNSDLGGPEEAAGRFFLQAQIARTRNDPVDEANFLERATNDIGLTGLKARIRLAELHVTGNDNDRPKSIMFLADTARVYRDTNLGQSAAAVLSDLRLSQGDYMGALQVSTDITAALKVQRADSYGAALAAKVLRQLLVAKDAPNLPTPEQRLMIYWRYNGYATPGEKGDDVRMGAAQLMLDQAMPEAALDVTRQFSASTAQSPRGAFLRASAEALAGDPNLAMSLLNNLPSDEGTKNIAAEALERLGKPLDAAHQLDGMTGSSQQMRRAALLYEAKDWSAAADAYADVLHSETIEKDDHDEAATRYALAIALSGKAPAPDLHGFTGLALHVMKSIPTPQTKEQPERPVEAIRDSLNRAAQIETLLPQTNRAPPAPGG